MQNTESKLFLYFICCISAMGGLLFGYDWVVIGGAKPFYEQFFHIYDAPVMQGVATSTALVGCLVGDPAGQIDREIDWSNPEDE